MNSEQQAAAITIAASTAAYERFTCVLEALRPIRIRGRYRHPHAFEFTWDRLLGRALGVDERCERYGQMLHTLPIPHPQNASATIAAEVSVAATSAVRAGVNAHDTGKAAAAAAVNACTRLFEHVATDLASRWNTFRDNYRVVHGSNAQLFEATPETVGGFVRVFSYHFNADRQTVLEHLLWIYDRMPAVRIPDHCLDTWDKLMFDLPAEEAIRAAATIAAVAAMPGTGAVEAAETAADDKGGNIENA